MKKNVFILSVMTVAFTGMVTAQTATTDPGVVINGVKWATRNVDKPETFAAAPEDAGLFYQWNGKRGWSSTEPLSSTDGASEWNVRTKEKGDISWEKSNDPCPAGWRVPVLDEIKTLLDDDKVTHEWTTENGVNGKKFTDKASGNTIFMPAAGYRYGNAGALHYAGLNGNYWNSPQNSSEDAFYFGFGSDYAGMNLSFGKAIGLSCRCVAE